MIKDVLAPELARRFAKTGVLLGEKPGIVATFPSAHPDAGMLTIIDDGDEATRGADLPSVLVASVDGEPAGSATLRSCDTAIRDDLTPWLGQLFVAPSYRQRGIGPAWVRAIAAEA